MQENRLKETFLKLFDKIYILSMVNRKDRRDLVESQLSKLNLDIPDTTNFIRYYYGTTFPFNDLITKAFNDSKKGRFTKVNEYDCARNHYAMVKICYELGFEHCMILEDDILFLKDTDKLSDYFNSLPKDYDIAQFGGFTVDNRIKQYIGNTYDLWVKHPEVGVWNASGYCLSRKGMMFYITFMENVLFWVADGPLYKAPLNHKLINTYISREPLVIQADKNIVSSDIRDANNDKIDYNTQNVYEREINLADYFSVE